MILGLASSCPRSGSGDSTATPSPTRTSMGRRLPRSLSPLVAELDRLGISRVFTNYWLAYRLDFDTNERIVAVERRFEKLERTKRRRASRLTTRRLPGRPTRTRCEQPHTGSCSSTTSFLTGHPRDARTARLYPPLRGRVRRLRPARGGQPTVSRSFGKLVRSSSPSSRTTARSSIRTPPTPGR